MSIIFNPCCCMSLQRGTSILAVIDIILNALSLVLFTLALIAGISARSEDITQEDRTTLIATSVILIIMSICQICLALYLRKAARNRDYRACRVWLIVAVIVFVIGVIDIGLSFHLTSNIASLSSNAVGVIYKLYEMMVVFYFMRELLISDGQPARLDA